MYTLMTSWFLLNFMYSLRMLSIANRPLSSTCSAQQEYPKQTTQQILIILRVKQLVYGLVLSNVKLSIYIRECQMPKLIAENKIINPCLRSDHSKPPEIFEIIKHQFINGFLTTPVIQEDCQRITQAVLSTSLRLFCHSYFYLIYIIGNYFSCF